MHSGRSRWVAVLLLSLPAISLAQQIAIGAYALPTVASGPRGIAAGPDGALWFTEAYGNKIGRITAAGAIVEYPLPTFNSVPEGLRRGRAARCGLWRPMLTKSGGSLQRG
jgi:streptogramin lyase